MLIVVLLIWIGLWGALGLVVAAIVLAVKRLLNRPPSRVVDPVMYPHRYV